MVKAIPVSYTHLDVYKRQVLDAARQNALQEHAQTLAYMERDLADGVAEAVFQDTEIFRGGFPELTDRLAGLLDEDVYKRQCWEPFQAVVQRFREPVAPSWERPTPARMLT